MLFLDFLKVKKIMKICSKTHQIAPLKKKISGKHAPGPGTPVAKSWLCHASQAPPPNNNCPPGKSCIRP